MYSIVFGGFSAESLQSRILDGKLLHHSEVSVCNQLYIQQNMPYY